MSKRPGDRKARKNNWLAYASGFGGICMFISWLGENVLESEMSSKAAQIQREVQFINSEMPNVTTWLLKFQDERRKQAADPEIIMNSAIQYGERTGTIVEAASRVDPDFYGVTEPRRRACEPYDSPCGRRRQ